MELLSSLTGSQPKRCSENTVGKSNNEMQIQQGHLGGLLAQSSHARHIRVTSLKSRRPAPKKASYWSHTTLFFLVFFVVFNISIFFFFINQARVIGDSKKKKTHTYIVKSVSFTHFNA